MNWMDELPFRATRLWTPAAATPEGKIVASLVLPETVNQVTPTLQMHALADRLSAMSRASEDPQTSELLIVEMLDRMRLTDEVAWTETALEAPLDAVVKDNQLLYASLQGAGLTPSGVTEIATIDGKTSAEMADWTVETWLDALSEVTEMQAAA